MKLDKYIERLCSKDYSEDVLLKLLDYIMINKDYSTHLLEKILKQYYKNDKDFKKSGYILLDGSNEELYRALKARMTIFASMDNNFDAVKNYSYLFDECLQYDAGYIDEDGCIYGYKFGCAPSLLVGLPIYDLSNNKLGVLSYISDKYGYWWKILDYKGKEQRIKTYWQLLKEQEIKQRKINGSKIIRTY